MEHFTLALQLAQQSTGWSSPNPRVGCVIVSANGQMIGSGYTQRPGQPHAEIMALHDVANRGASPAGSTVYVTLEPCSHYGRTPPCCDALISAGVAKVVVALQDPNPLVSGKGMERLRTAGIEVELLAPDSDIARAARELNIGFVQRMQHGRPWVRLKTATSLDGRTALPNGNSLWITDATARADVQHWRARACAILTGVGTVLHDNPLLNLRLSQQPQPPQPPLFVLDSQLRTPPTARILGVPDRKVWLCASQTHQAKLTQRAAALQATGAHILWLPANTHDKPCLHALLQELGRLDINELHVEAGATLNGALLRHGHVDEILAYIAPMLLGPGQPLAALPAMTDLGTATRWQLHEARTLGNDMRLRLRPPAAAAAAASTQADSAAYAPTASLFPAPSTHGGDTPFGKKAIEAEITTLFDNWNTALQKGDPKTLVDLYDQDAILLPTVSNIPRRTHAEIEDYFEHFMARHPVCTIDLRHVQIGYNQAVVSGLYTFTFEGSDEKIRARYTYTYRWNGKEWKISSHHSSAMPEKPETNTPLIDARCSQLRAISLT